MADKKLTPLRPNDTWKENFHINVTVKCRNETCENLVTTHAAVVASYGKYCDECFLEAQRLSDRRYEAQHRAARNARKRKK